MTKPRSHFIDEDHPRFYHIASRCVRRAYLLGTEPRSGRNHDHRKTVFLDRLKLLARHFTVNVMAYATMSNHFHLVVYYDPNGGRHWSAEEVARRWCSVFYGAGIEAQAKAGESIDDFNLQQTLRYQELLLNPKRIERCRSALSSLSRFMQHLKQPFAAWANRQDKCTGHFFESRFYSGVLLTEGDLLSCMAYVDLNPVQAGIAKSIREARHTSAHERLYKHRFDESRLEEFLAPLWKDKSSIRTGRSDLSCRLKHYSEQLSKAIAHLQHPTAPIPDTLDSWMARLLNREKRKRAQLNQFFDYAM